MENPRGKWEMLSLLRKTMSQIHIRITVLTKLRKGRSHSDFRNQWSINSRRFLWGCLSYTCRFGNFELRTIYTLRRKTIFWVCGKTIQRIHFCFQTCFPIQLFGRYCFKYSFVSSIFSFFNKINLTGLPVSVYHRHKRRKDTFLSPAFATFSLRSITTFFGP